ncbi:unnamed protein product [Urochloa humidicola]
MPVTIVWGAAQAEPTTCSSETPPERAARVKSMIHDP